jgi:hypothetical protein
MVPSEGKRNIRQTLAQLAERNSEALQPFFEDAMAANRTISVSCPNSRHRHQIEVPDWRARQLAVSELLNQGYGRPGTENSGTGEVTVHRRLVFPDGTIESVQGAEREQPLNDPA